MSVSTRRALHFVFKIGNRTKTAEFFRDVLGMKFLRHEEFEKGCDAACNGPYDGKWSKSMVGYGPEHTSFVMELTYNYGLGTYKLGNDFRGITIYSKDALRNATKLNYPVVKDGESHILTSPDGYKFIIKENEPKGDPVKKVTLASSDLEKTIDYWTRLCGMKVYHQDEKTVLLGYADDQCKLEFYDIGRQVDHGSAFGRIAFSCPGHELSDIQDKIKEENQKILTPLISLDTPGKATVQVVILADPDQHEICFVGDEGFRSLSEVDVKADELLDEAIKADKSDEWFAKKGKTKAVAE